MNTGLTSTSIALLLSECTQHLHRFFHALDRRNYDEVLELFADDGRWFRQGRWIEGKKALREALEMRSIDVETRHVLTNSFVSNHAASTVEVEAYMTAYRYPAVNASCKALPRIAHPLRFNLVTTVFRRADITDWRIAEQQLVAAFAFEE